MVDDWISPVKETDITVADRHEYVEGDQQNIVEHNSNREGLYKENQCHFFMGISEELEHGPGPDKGALKFEMG